MIGLASRRRRSALESVGVGTMVGRVVFGILFVFWTLLPLYTAISAAFTSRSDIFSGRLWPEHPTFENFRLLLFGGAESPLPLFWLQLGNSLISAASVTVLALTISAAASYAISRLMPSWGTPVSSAALVLYIVPASFLVIPLYLLLGGMGLLDTLVGLIVGLTMISLPYSVWMLRQFGATLPIEIEEAAKLDGAGPVRIFGSVYLPLIRSALVPVGLYVFLLAWNDFLYSFMFLTRAEQLTVPVAMYSIATENAPWPQLMASGMIYAVIPLMLFIFFRRYLVSGTTQGATVG
ncbi:carbohydrate ABC transporter permease [Microbacterium sp. 179-I 3D3 NHS]|uniref:carbohydrate ABC transporter permease n=1 Tax=Microbacterium sp. 179-I 3D3 NHS TaxID=3142382 RepID=UPI0039A3DE0E